MKNNFISNYYCNNIRSFLISFGSVAVCSSHLLSLEGGEFKLMLSVDITNKLTNCLFWCLYFLLGQRPAIKNLGFYKYFSITFNSISLCQWLTFLFFSMDTPLTLYTKVEVGGINLKKRSVESGAYWLWFLAPLTTLFYFKKILFYLFSEDYFNYDTVEYGLGFSFFKKPYQFSKKFIEDADFTLRLLNFQTFFK